MIPALGQGSRDPAPPFFRAGGRSPLGGGAIWERSPSPSPCPSQKRASSSSLANSGTASRDSTTPSARALQFLPLFFAEGERGAVSQAVAQATLEIVGLLAGVAVAYGLFLASFLLREMRKAYLEDQYPARKRG